MKTTPGRSENWMRGRRGQTRGGFTLVEIMVVITIALMILLASTRLWSGFQRQAHLGMDRLTSLNTSRRIVELVRRDLKALCLEPTLVPPLPDIVTRTSGSVREYEFHLFPTAALVPDDDELARCGLPTAVNPVNRVVYRFSTQDRTLTRILHVHPYLQQAKRVGPEERRVLAEIVDDFAITKRRIFGQTAYDIEVQTLVRKSTTKLPVRLRTSVRPKFEYLLERHQAQVPNLDSIVQPAR